MSTPDKKFTELVNWTDLQFLAELARQGSLSAAARALGVTHATVARRIAVLDDGFGQPLFKREAGRYVPTDLGSQIVALAKEMEEPALRVSRAMAGVMPEIAGPVRITATDLISAELIVPALPALRSEHPGLEPEIIVSGENLSLARRDADIALRLGQPRQIELITRKLCDIGYYRYASHSYLKGRSPSDYGYIGYCNVPPEMGEVRTIEQFAKDAAIVARTNQLGARLSAVRHGLGIGLLPRFLADTFPALKRIDREPPMSRELYLIVHEDLKNVPRIKVCADHLAAAILCQRNKFV